MQGNVPIRLSLPNSCWLDVCQRNIEFLPAQLLFCSAMAAVSRKTLDMLRIDDFALFSRGGEVQRSVRRLTWRGRRAAQVTTVGTPLMTYRPGVVIPEVLHRSAGERAGLQAGDVLLGLNGQPLLPSPLSVPRTVAFIRCAAAAAAAASNASPRASAHACALRTAGVAPSAATPLCGCSLQCGPCTRGLAGTTRGGRSR